MDIWVNKLDWKFNREIQLENFPQEVFSRILFFLKKSVLFQNFSYEAFQIAILLDNFLKNCKNEQEKKVTKQIKILKWPTWTTEKKEGLYIIGLDFEKDTKKRLWIYKDISKDQLHSRKRKKNSH